MILFEFDQNGRGAVGFELIDELRELQEFDEGL